MKNNVNNKYRSASKSILFIAMNLGSGGAERQMVTIAGILKDRGYDVRVVCYENGDFFSHALEEKGIPIEWMIESNPVKRAIKMRYYIRKGRFDAVISYLEVASFLNNYAAIGGHSWKVITGERSAQEEHFKSLKGKLYGYMQRYSDVIVCNSHNARNLWIHYYPQYISKVITIYNTVRLNCGQEQYIVKKDGKTHIVVAASYQRLKNPIRMIQAVNLLSVNYQERLCIDWYGNRNFGRSVALECDALVEKYGLQTIVHLNDRTHDVISKMVQADFVALFSRVEGLPNSICEGMTLGKPIIMTKVSDYQIFVDESNGFLCDYDNIDSIKIALMRAIDCTKNQVLDMGLASNGKAQALFSMENIGNEWIDLIEGC